MNVSFRAGLRRDNDTLLSGAFGGSLLLLWTLAARAQVPATGRPIDSLALDESLPHQRLCARDRLCGPGQSVASIDTLQTWPGELVASAMAANRSLGPEATRSVPAAESDWVMAQRPLSRIRPVARRARPPADISPPPRASTATRSRSSPGSLSPWDSDRCTRAPTGLVVSAPRRSPPCWTVARRPALSSRGWLRPADGPPPSARRDRHRPRFTPPLLLRRNSYAATSCSCT
jgi:hypothetical protein